MKLRVVDEKFFDRPALWFGSAIRVGLCLLVVILMAALLVGIVKAGIDLVYSIRKPLEVILQSLLLDAVFILALTEIVITVLGYLRDGSVHVRYIVDTILIIMLNEVVAIWFKGPTLETAIGLSVTVATLAGVRIAVTRFAPDHA
jgi:uncharacterized membrane protein (DUF373 family)